MSPEMFDFLVVMSVLCIGGCAALLIVQAGLWIAVRWFGAPSWWLEEWK